MFFKSKNSKMNLEQHEQIEYAQSRIKQKKRLYNHFVLFIIGSIFFILINTILKIGETHNWFIWAITFWAFLFVIHLFNVFVTNKFMNRNWERQQREKLIIKQEKRLAELQQEIESEYPLHEGDKKKD